jgi:hypothetical protein
VQTLLAYGRRFEEPASDLCARAGIGIIVHDDHPLGAVLAQVLIQEAAEV